MFFPAGRKEVSDVGREAMIRADMESVGTYNPIFDKSIKQLAKSYGKRLQVADVLVDGDTTVWRATFKADSTDWTHFWAPGGPNGRYMNTISTFTTPRYLLIDSLGIYNYRGESLAELTKVLKAGGKKSPKKK